MNNGSWLLIVLALMLVVVARHPILALLVPVSLVVYWDFGSLGLGIFWPVLLALAIARRSQ